MRKKERCHLIAWLLPLSMVLLIAACSSSIEPELRRLASSPSLIVVVKDESDVYWAFRASEIKEVSTNKIILKKPTVVAKGSGTAPPDEIAKVVADLRSKANPGGFGLESVTTSKTHNDPINGTSWSLSASMEILDEEKEIVVEEIVYPKEKK
jgi:hypothetical protein